MAAYENLQKLFSQLCALGMQAELLTGFFRHFLTLKFQDGNLRRKSVRGLLWRDNQTTSILIESITRWRPELTQKRPGLIVKRNSYRNLRVGLDDFQGVTEEGADTHTAFWVGSHTIFCIREDGMAAELLAAEVRDYLLEMGPAVRRNLRLQQYQVQQVGELARLKGDQNPTNFVVPITVGWAYEHSWTIEQEAPRVRRIRLTMLLDQ